MATINWTIDRMDAVPLVGDRPNIVYTVYWSCIATDTDVNGNTVTASDSASCNVPYDPSTYVPYSDLTQDIVLGWVWNYGPVKELVEGAVGDKLSKLINPITTPPLPW